MLTYDQIIFIIENWKILNACISNDTLEDTYELYLKHPSKDIYAHVTTGSYRLFSLSKSARYFQEEVFLNQSLQNEKDYLKFDYLIITKVKEYFHKIIKDITSSEELDGYEQLL